MSPSEVGEGGMLALALLLATTYSSSGPKPVHLTPQVLDTVSAHCHTPRHWLVLDPTGELHVRPSNGAPYQKVDCLFKQLKRLGWQKIGYVSYEKP